MKSNRLGGHPISHPLENRQHLASSYTPACHCCWCCLVICCLCCLVCCLPLLAACCFVYCLVYCLATAAWYASYAWYTAWYTRWRSSITDTRQISALSQDQPRQTSHLIILLFCIFSVLICNTVTLQCIGRTNLVCFHATNTTVLWSQVVRAVLGLGFSKQKSCQFLIFSLKNLG